MGDTEKLTVLKNVASELFTNSSNIDPEFVEIFNEHFGDLISPQKGGWCVMNECPECGGRLNHYHKVDVCSDCGYAKGPAVDIKLCEKRHKWDDGWICSRCGALRSDWEEAKKHRKGVGNG